MLDQGARGCLMSQDRSGFFYFFAWGTTASSPFVLSYYSFTCQILFLASFCSFFLFAAPVAASGFVHALAVTVDETDYSFDRAPDRPSRAKDISGHYWAHGKGTSTQLLVKRYNTGPFGTPQWWSSDALMGKCSTL